MDYPKVRELDGVYFMVERGEGERKPICFSDMTHEERKRVGEGRPTEWWASLANILADTLHEVGDEFGIVASVASDDE